jgi:hypothetical protein
MQAVLQAGANDFRSDASRWTRVHPSHPRAFHPRRSLPPSTLVATLLCMRATSQQSLLGRVTTLSASAELVRGVSDRAFAKARSHLQVPPLTDLNDDLLARYGASGLMPPPRWPGSLASEARKPRSHQGRELFGRWGGTRVAPGVSPNRFL